MIQISGIVFAVVDGGHGVRPGKNENFFLNYFNICFNAIGFLQSLLR